MHLIQQVQCQAHPAHQHSDVHILTWLWDCSIAQTEFIWIILELLCTLSTSSQQHHIYAALSNPLSPQTALRVLKSPAFLTISFPANINL